MITQTIDLCMIPGSTNPVIHVNQYDAYPGGLIFNLYEESAFEIPSGAAVTINGTKPDKYGFSYTASYSGNVVTADLEQQMTAVAGNVECELRVSLGSEIIGTQNFTLAVEEAALNNGTIISETDIPALVNAQRYASEAAASADAAAGSAESAAASAAAAAQDFSNAVKYTDIVNNGTYSGAAGEKVLDAAMGKTLTDSKVAKAGDTMTGALKIQAQDITIGTLPSANTFSASRVTFEDSDGVRMGYLAPFYLTTDVNGYDISAVRTVNGTDYFNSLKLEVDANGNSSIRVTNPAAWRSALAQNNVDLNSIMVTGCVSYAKKGLMLGVPYPFFYGTSMSINTMSVILRHMTGSSYIYLRSGADGSTYTPTGVAKATIISNGAPIRSNEISSFSVSLIANWGFVIKVYTVYPMCINGTGTEVTNNSLIVADLTLSGMIS